MLFVSGHFNIPWRRKWQPTPVLLPGKSHGQRSLVGYSPWGRKESDTTEWLHFHFNINDVTALFLKEKKNHREIVPKYEKSINYEDKYRMFCLYLVASEEEL